MTHIIMCIHNRLRGNMIEQDVNRRGRVGALLSSPSSLEGTDTQPTLLQSLLPSLCLTAMLDLNNISPIIYLFTSPSRSLSQTNTPTRTDMKLSPHAPKLTHTYMPGGVGSRVPGLVWSERAGIRTEGNLIGIPCAKHMRSPWLTDPASPAPSLQCRQIKTLHLCEINCRTKEIFLLRLLPLLNSKRHFVCPAGLGSFYKDRVDFKDSLV